MQQEDSIGCDMLEFNLIDKVVSKASEYVPKIHGVEKLQGIFVAHFQDIHLIQRIRQMLDVLNFPQSTFFYCDL